MSMTPRLRLITGFCAIGFLLIGVCIFLFWAAGAEVERREQWIEGAQVVSRRVVGPPGPAIAAAWPALLGVAIGLDWLLTAIPGKKRTPASTPHLRLYRGIAVFQALTLIALLVPGAFIALVGASQLAVAPEMHKRVARFERGRPAREAKQSFPILIEQLKDRNPAVRAEAAESIGELEVYLSQRAVPALTNLLDDEDRVAMAAAKTLGKIGVYSRPAVPKLAILMENGSRGRRRPVTMEPDPVRVCAAEALARIPHQGPWALQERLKHTNPEVRRCAAYGLGLIGPKSDRYTATQRLKAALKDEDERVRAAAREAISKLDPETETRER